MAVVRTSAADSIAHAFDHHVAGGRILAWAMWPVPGRPNRRVLTLTDGTTLDLGDNRDAQIAARVLASAAQSLTRGKDQPG